MNPVKTRGKPWPTERERSACPPRSDEIAPEAHPASGSPGTERRPEERQRGDASIDRIIPAKAVSERQKPRRCYGNRTRNTEFGARILFLREFSPDHSFLEQRREEEQDGCSSHSAVAPARSR
ncbi:unnamed protein product [Boreogadus saida]